MFDKLSSLWYNCSFRVLRGITCRCRLVVYFTTIDYLRIPRDNFTVETIITCTRKFCRFFINEQIWNNHYLTSSIQCNSEIFTDILHIPQYATYIFGSLLRTQIMSFKKHFLPTEIRIQLVEKYDSVVCNLDVFNIVNIDV